MDINKKEIPSSFKQGDICIGYTTVNGKEEKIFFNQNPWYESGLLITGKYGSGKTTYLKSYINDCLKKGDSVVVLDYIKNSSLTSSIKEFVPQDKLVLIDCEDIENLESLSYNELIYTDDMCMREKINIIHSKAKYSLSLLNCLSDKELSNMARMYFISIATIVYSVNQFATIKDIVNCLTDYDTRMDYINRISKDLKETEIMKDRINTALRLTALSSEKSVEEILSIFYSLKECIQYNLMFEKTSRNIINFENCFNEGKIIVIKINDDISDNMKIRDMISLFFITKTYLSCKNRLKNKSKLNTVHLIIDEVGSLFSNTLKELGKHSLWHTKSRYLKLVLTTQNVSQLPKNLLVLIEASHFNYMFLSDLNEKNYKIFEPCLSRYTFDIKNIERYHSLNLVLSSADGSRNVFTTKLPNVLEI